ncbi:hypothetical protein T552_02853 [Pneumocystis carinii B80]|uniref:30S ribosomal protein S8 n=1 Tax=Pneumocystis carinii (strain B80) TaxID=1408658 RepID=A0A0W4ZDD3_PNEC8|nr:hypothetical protein T552_02853 [Pneumocystis carinii B80]KTW26371.1 hypothetical protein T552_02853 [Pneumocystis carinii B80]
MPSLHYLCSHLQNASRAYLAQTSLPATKLNLDICLGLYTHGLLGSVRRGSYWGPDTVYTPITCENISTRRIWVDLKYQMMRPVLKEIKALNRPGRRQWMSAASLALLTRQRVHFIPALGLGECIFVRTRKGVMEIREAIGLNLGGELLCRVS